MAIIKKPSVEDNAVEVCTVHIDNDQDLLTALNLSDSNPPNVQFRYVIEITIKPRPYMDFWNDIVVNNILLSRADFIDRVRINGMYRLVPITSVAEFMAEMERKTAFIAQIPWSTPGKLAKAIEDMCLTHGVSFYRID